MRIHHLDCGTCHPLGGALMDGISQGPRARLSCHCLLIETDASGLVLVDTGFGLRDVRRPYALLGEARLPWWNASLLNIRLDPARTAVGRIRALGLDPADVRHIVMTHLDFDHAGGLQDFPGATIHLTAAEAEAAQHRHGALGRTRWRPAQWRGTRDRWRMLETRLGRRGGGGESWFGFRNVRQPEGLPPEILLVPLPGHTPGHAGVAVQGPRGWLLHAGDAYFHRAELHGPGPEAAPRLLRSYEKAMTDDAAEREENLARLRSLVQGPDGKDIAVFCTHDAVELVAMTVFSARAPREVAAEVV
jgi:glyoxylase-like metal-dependent hydrolase (beta-lactamase superfamily II)